MCGGGSELFFFSTSTTMYTRCMRFIDVLDQLLETGERLREEMDRELEASVVHGPTHVSSTQRLLEPFFAPSTRLLNVSDAPKDAPQYALCVACLSCFAVL